ncbi:hypothetical protein QJS10_CPB21g00731 [Acorus calamus]|uniref:DUF4408 domain-containing protein n=1 Tax=Acorus calamus TaxID=4465 RepID=A0AAV9C8L5_ACOCL|nr:hypothetical protein QJS10_CPB21g00731 [Acorus calamus]
MATIHQSSSSSWAFMAKVILTSTAVLSTAVLLKQSLPSISAFAVSEARKIWTSLLTWLTPPYLYFVINGIIISIAASSRFFRGFDDRDPAPAAKITYQTTTLTRMATPLKELIEFAVPSPEEDYGASSVVTTASVQVEEEEEEVDFVISRSESKPVPKPAPKPSPQSEKPLVSSRFGHRKPLKPSPGEGKALGVARQRRNETLESTWRTITDGRAVPLTRHLKKLDTWENQSRPSPVPEMMMKKSETFDEKKGRLRRDPSMSQEELNKRVEAFINKFNQDMMLQRQESLQQYMEMVSRGSH